MLSWLWCAPLLVSGKRGSSGRRFRRRHDGDGDGSGEGRELASNGDGEDVGGLAAASNSPV
jgi:hypothetical protein